MNKKRKSPKPANFPFPPEVFVQHAFETGETDSKDDSWMVINDRLDNVAANIRCGVYKLDRIVTIDRSETFTEKPAK